MKVRPKSRLVYSPLVHRALREVVVRGQDEHLVPVQRGCGHPPLRPGRVPGRLQGRGQPAAAPRIRAGLDREQQGLPGHHGRAAVGRGAQPGRRPAGVLLHGTGLTGARVEGGVLGVLHLVHRTPVLLQIPGRRIRIHTMHRVPPPSRPAQHTSRIGHRRAPTLPQARPGPVQQQPDVDPGPPGLGIRRNHQTRPVPGHRRKKAALRRVDYAPSRRGATVSAPQPQPLGPRVLVMPMRPADHDRPVAQHLPPQRPPGRRAARGARPRQLPQCAAVPSGGQAAVRTGPDHDRALRIPADQHNRLRRTIRHLDRQRAQLPAPARRDPPERVPAGRAVPDHGGATRRRTVHIDPLSRPGRRRKLPSTSDIEDARIHRVPGWEARRMMRSRRSHARSRRPRCRRCSPRRPTPDGTACRSSPPRSSRELLRSTRSRDVGGGHRRARP